MSEDHDYNFKRECERPRWRLFESYRRDSSAQITILALLEKNKKQTATYWNRYPALIKQIWHQQLLSVVFLRMKTPCQHNSSSAHSFLCFQNDGDVRCVRQAFSKKITAIPRVVLFPLKRHARLIRMLSVSAAKTSSICRERRHLTWYRLKRKHRAW